MLEQMAKYELGSKGKVVGCKEKRAGGEDELDPGDGKGDGLTEEVWGVGLKDADGADLLKDEV